MIGLSQRLTPCVNASVNQRGTDIYFSEGRGGGGGGMKNMEKKWFAGPKKTK